LNSGYPFLHDYSDRPNWVSRIDARLRIIAGLVLVFLIALILEPTAYLLVSISIVLTCVLVRLSWIDYRRILTLSIPMAAITLVLHLLFNRSGHIVIASPFGLAITQEALITGLMFCWRLALFFVAAICLTKIISPDDFAMGIWQLLAPLKRLGLAIDGVAMSLWVAIRFIPTILSQYHQIVFAQKARGATFDGGLLARTRKLAPLLIPVTVAAIRKSDILADALTVRGWGVGEKRTFYQSRPLAIVDYAFILTVMVWGGVILWIGL
jgi:energy-coupling factor transporter transmembrane protein EcfT